MKAIVRTQYGSPEVLQFAEVATPTPADNEVMIKLCAASVNPLDLFLMKGAPWNRVIPGLRTPKHKVLGCDIAGRVEAVGRHVKQFQPGDEVFGVRGFGGGGFGARFQMTRLIPAVFVPSRFRIVFPLISAIVIFTSPLAASFR